MKKPSPDLELMFEELRASMAIEGYVLSDQQLLELGK